MACCLSKASTWTFWREANSTRSARSSTPSRRMLAASCNSEYWSISRASILLPGLPPWAVTLRSARSAMLAICALTEDRRPSISAAERLLRAVPWAVRTPNCWAWLVRLRSWSSFSEVMRTDCWAASARAPSSASFLACCFSLSLRALRTTSVCGATTCAGAGSAGACSGSAAMASAAAVSAWATSLPAWAEDAGWGSVLAISLRLSRMWSRPRTAASSQAFTSRKYSVSPSASGRGTAPNRVSKLWIRVP